MTYEKSTSERTIQSNDFKYFRLFWSKDKQLMTSKKSTSQKKNRNQCLLQLYYFSQQISTLHDMNEDYIRKEKLRPMLLSPSIFINNRYRISLNDRRSHQKRKVDRTIYSNFHNRLTTKTNI
jgi:hypothetical protein